MKEKHNGTISFWKFAFSLLIVALHLGKSHIAVKYNFAAGSIGVDFFFLVSGYLFCHKCLKTTNENTLREDTISFMTYKIRRFLPYILFLWIVTIPFAIVLERYTADDYVSALYNLLYLPVKGNRILDMHGITWYITALIIIETMFYPLVVKYKKNFVTFISPLIAFFGTGYILIKYGTFAIPWENGTFCYGGIIRGITVINLGMVLYLLVSRIKEVKFTDLSRFLMTLFEILGYISIFYICNKPSAHPRFDCLMIIILFICITISFSGKSMLYEFANNEVFYYLEQLSLPIYLLHWPVIILTLRVVAHFNLSIDYYQELLIIIALTIIGAALTEYLIGIYNKNKESIKKLFIEI